MDSQEPVLIFVLVALICLSACFSATETAITSVNSIRLKNKAKEDKKAEKAYQAYKQGTAAITTILIGNNIVNILSTAIATNLFSTLFPGGAGVAIATAIMTVTILIFGEIAPKVVAKSKPENIVILMARPLLFLIWFLKPLNMIVVKIQSHWERKNNIENVTATEDEFLEIVSTIEHEGVLEQEERELIENAIEFDDTSVHDIMVPRDEVIWVYDTISKSDLTKVLKENKLSRFPVISHETLNVIGVLHVRDVFDAMLSNKKFVVTELMNEPIFVSQRKKLPQALEDLQKSRIHMAIVTESAKIDNFVGVVTLEDIVEEIVGEIYDEYDALPDHVFEIGLHTYEVDATVNLTHFFDEYLEDLELPKTKAKTIAQWIFELNDNKKVRKGREIEYENLEIKVLATNEGFATRVQIKVYTAMEEE